MSNMNVRPSRWRLVGLASAAALVLSAVGISQTPVAQTAIEPDPQTAATAFGHASFADVIEQVSPAVVNITVTQVMRAAPTAGVPRGMNPRFEEFFERFFEGPAMPRQRRSQGQGSGFLVGADGYVVTNNHVVDDAEEITVTLQDGEQLDATLVGSDPKTDLALLKIEADRPLPYLRFGNSDDARVGDWVLAIGNPFGLGGTATAGIISARGRDIRSGPYDDFLQIDAPINRGNSGGPVFNVRGEVIGVNTAIFSPTGGNIGIGFAIPANQARDVIAQLKADGSVERGWLGVQIQNLDEGLAAALDMEGTEGALVADILGDGPAREAGLMTGDVITRFDGEPIDSARALSHAVGSRRPGERVSVTAWRNGDSETLDVTLGDAARNERAAASGPASGSGEGGADAPAALGLELAPLTDRHRARLELEPDTRGVVVVGVDPNGEAARKGLRPGDVITQINQQPVDSVRAALAALGDAEERDAPALVLVRRGNAQRFVSLAFS